MEFSRGRKIRTATSKNYQGGKLMTKKERQGTNFSKDGEVRNFK
jgi:hypothetical protein